MLIPVGVWRRRGIWEAVVVKCWPEDNEGGTEGTGVLEIQYVVCVCVCKLKGSHVDVSAPVCTCIQRPWVNLSFFSKPIFALTFEAGSLSELGTR